MRRRGARDGNIRAIEALVVRAMPQVADRAKLARAAEGWARVVGPQLGERSAPLDLVNGELLVAAETPLVGNRLSMMTAGIVRALMREWGLEVKKVKVVVGRLPLKTAAPAVRGPARPPDVRVREEDVAELRRRCADADLPEDAAESLARLQAFFNRRFQDRRGRGL